MEWALAAAYGRGGSGTGRKGNVSRGYSAALIGQRSQRLIALGRLLTEQGEGGRCGARSCLATCLSEMLNKCPAQCGVTLAPLLLLLPSTAPPIKMMSFNGCDCLLWRNVIIRSRR